MGYVCGGFTSATRNSAYSGRDTMASESVFGRHGAPIVASFLPLEFCMGGSVFSARPHGDAGSPSSDTSAGDCGFSARPGSCARGVATLRGTGAGHLQAVGE